MPRTAALIPAAGMGIRMATSDPARTPDDARDRVPKQFLPLAGVPILSRTLQVFESCPAIDSIVLVVPAEQQGLVRELGLPAKVSAVVAGGSHRQQSVMNGLLALASAPEGPPEWVVVHDGVRPLVTPDLIERVLEAARRMRAATAGLMARETIKEVGPDGIVRATPARDRLWTIQTPQAFAFGLLLEAHREAAAGGQLFTDDCALVEALGQPVQVVEGDEANLKVTTPLDLEVAEALLRRRARAQEPGRGDEPAPAGVPGTEGSKGRRVRVGIGYDVHRLVSDRPLVIGGVRIPSEKGLLGHSDADVLLHAVIDAMLGAAGLGDIGRHFPDRDPRFAGASSVNLLRSAAQLLAKEGLRVAHVDAVVVCERPRILPHVPAMAAGIREALGGAAAGDLTVNIKGKSTEGLGFEGEGLGISAQAVVTVIEVEPR